MNKKSAETIVNFSTDFSSRLDELFKSLEKENSNEVEELKVKFGQVLGQLYFVCLPLWKEFPDLMPDLYVPDLNGSRFCPHKNDNK